MKSPCTEGSHPFPPVRHWPLSDVERVSRQDCGLFTRRGCCTKPPSGGWSATGRKIHRIPAVNSPSRQLALELQKVGASDAYASINPFSPAIESQSLVQ